MATPAEGCTTTFDNSSAFGRQVSGDPVLQPANEPLKLSSFRQNLIRQEETIIFALIERAQFPRNSVVVEGGKNAIMIGGRPLLDHMLREQECAHALVRRYTSPDENPFFVEAAEIKPVLPMVDFPSTIKPNRINMNARIKNIYLERILSAITAEGNDSRTYGSCCVADIHCLQALSKRIHFGKFIAEAKFQQNPEKYSELISNHDAEGLMALLTDLPQEERVLDRVEKKASTYGQDLDNADGPPEYKVDPKVIREMYRDIVMPLTKEVQVEYLLQRLRESSVACCGPQNGLAYRAARLYFGVPEEDLAVMPADRPDLVFSQVSSNAAAHGVVVVETQRDCANMQVKKLLLESNVKITAELVWDGGAAGSTTCLVISKAGANSTGADSSCGDWEKEKTCIAFGTSHESGALIQALNAFQKHSVNLTYIACLPIGDTANPESRYDFLVEFNANLDDPEVGSAVKELVQQATFVRHLGTYKRRRLST